ncbi:M28 family metallopeptidase [Sandarakinorhabdus sp.]|uniref:M28 family metallopeptidase n=1 Tax=Sandarakinorhabdus sp. TaxID=1916663 RepID=UPI00286E9002|nr:M28 family metallopeptidase [Sandarakinorhabdus sp.]
MNRLLFAACVLASLPVMADPVFSPDRIRADVGFLADDLLEGRDTGSRGHDIAARFVATEFAKAGLKPAGSDGWFKPVGLAVTSLVPGSASLTLIGKGGETVLPHAGDVIVSADMIRTAADIEAPLVFVGFGIDAPAHGHDDYRGLDVKGKIVVAIGGIPKGPPDEVLAHLASKKGEMAAARGAVGFIGLIGLRGQKQYPWPRRLETANEPSMTWVAKDGTPHVEGAALQGAVQLSPSAAEMLFADARRPLADVLAQADSAGGRPRGFALPGRARIKAQSVHSRITSPEVIGLLPGRDPVLKDEYVVIMAHLDHIGISASKKGDKINNGALDNASGVAVMLEAARAFAASPPPKRSVLFIANTGEEKGLLGAEAYADDPGIPVQKIVGVVDLDMPLLLYDFTDVIAFGADHTTMGNVIASAAAQAGVTLSADPMPEEAIFVRSDHYTMVKRGVPAVMLATGFAGEGAKAWRHFLETDYHQPSDDMKLPINWQAAAKFARVNFLIASRLADDSQRPLWYQGDYFGQTFAPAAPKAPRAAK